MTASDLDAAWNAGWTLGANLPALTRRFNYAFRVAQRAKRTEAVAVAMGAVNEFREHALTYLEFVALLSAEGERTET